MATVAALLAALLSGINIGLGLHGIWKRWQSRATPIPPHPLESALRDVALAIRERPQETVQDRADPFLTPRYR